MINRIVLRFYLLFLPVLLNAYVDDATCKACHEKEFASWKHSDHALAMQKATSKTVLGDFDNATFKYNNIVTKFYKKDGKFFVRTDNAQGKMEAFQISYTFGVYPLQQYMIKMPKGAIQVLDIAWDSRSKAEGGQRWYHLHPNDKVDHNSMFHWSGKNLNWNFMCSDCHSTNVKKNYDLKTKSYHTTYDAINVSCAMCHGDATTHAKWAKNPKRDPKLKNRGFGVDYSHFKKRVWNIDKESGKPTLQGAIDRTEVQNCAPCHSRREQLRDGYTPEKKMSDYYLATAVREPHYFSDGKVKEEDYVYGSFLQSKMYDAGVSCSDCHDVHSLKRKAVGSNVCYKCHLPSMYDTPKHHHHKQKSATCIECHMNAKTYMGVDARNDHSFRIPRPDLSELTHSQNSCKDCHADRSNRDLASALKRWYNKTPKGFQTFGEALHYLNSNDKRAYKSMYAALIAGQSDIIKASLTEYLGNYPSRQTYTTTLQMLSSRSPWVRVAAVRSLEKFGLQRAAKELFKMLDDDAMVVRTEAIRVLSSFPVEALSVEQKKIYNKALQEYKESLLYNADRAESQAALAMLYSNQQQYDKAKAAYKEAIRLQKWFVPAYVNYSELLRTTDSEQLAHKVLMQGLKNNPDSAALYHALGLWQVRNQQNQAALLSLQKAHQLQPQDARFAYVYAVAIAQSDKDKAIEILKQQLKLHSGDRNIQGAIAYYEQQ